MADLDRLVRLAKLARPRPSRGVVLAVDADKRDAILAGMLPQ
jgi:hypothetical protein